jgi:hypothetical protein
MSEHNTTNTVDGITLVTEPAAAYLNERQLVDYRAQRRDCIEWLLALGKPPYLHGLGYTRVDETTNGLAEPDIQASSDLALIDGAGGIVLRDEGLGDDVDPLVEVVDDLLGPPALA